MIDHVSIPVTDLERAAVFYDTVLATVGIVQRKASPSAVGYGPVSREAAVFWLLTRKPQGSAVPGFGLHVSFCAPSRASVDAFHAAALRSGARDAGAPGVRSEYTQPFYGAFVFDLDGFKVEAVCRATG